MNPYTLPNKPRVTIRSVLCWIAQAAYPVTSRQVATKFWMTAGDAFVRMNKLWKWGYVRRTKRSMPPRVYEYAASRFGRKAATRWTKEKKRS